MWRLGLVSTCVAALGMVVLWVLDPDLTAVLLAFVVWLVGVAFVVAAIFRTGLWVVRRTDAR
jgi:hypothetical protein